MKNEKQIAINPFFSLLMGKYSHNLTAADLPNLEILERFLGPTRGSAGTWNAIRWVGYYCALALIAALVGSGNYISGVVGLSLLFCSLKVARGARQQNRR